jgi:hypothetical protein
LPLIAAGALFVLAALLLAGHLCGLALPQSSMVIILDVRYLLRD